MNMEHKLGVFEEKLEAYCKGSKEEKGRILGSVTDVTGLTRSRRSSDFGECKCAVCTCRTAEAVPGTTRRTVLQL